MPKGQKRKPRNILFLVFSKGIYTNVVAEVYTNEVGYFAVHIILFYDDLKFMLI